MLERLSQCSFEMGPIRPPSEGGVHSLLIRATKNCPWNLCRFCDTYKNKNFKYRSVEEIKKDIQTAKIICEGLTNAIQKINYNNMRPQLYLYSNPSVINVFEWLVSGARTVFLQDANSLIMRTSELVDVVKHLKRTFPSIQRITSYARAKTLSQKTRSLEDLKELHKAGLTRLHVGLESGDDEVLTYVNKGVTAKEQVEAGRKVLEAGFELSEYVMPGLGGRFFSEQHAENTAKVLNKINPDFIRLRSYVPRRGTELYEEYEKATFQLSSPYERLIELKILVTDLEVNSKLCFDHMMNSWYIDSNHLSPLFTRDYDGYKLPEEKKEVLELIEIGLAVPESYHIHAKQLIGMLL